VNTLSLHDALPISLMFQRSSDMVFTSFYANTTLLPLKSF
jgi:hypothetical protein